MNTEKESMNRITAKDLTIEQKLKLLIGVDGWHFYDAEGKLPKISVSDGPVGVRKEITREDGTSYIYPSVCYPSISTLANSWSRETAKKMGNALGDDCIECDVDILLAPGVNIKRYPLNGRNFEYFSEDPYLAGTLAKEYVEGVQSKGVGTCVKHYFANNNEFNRDDQCSEVDERTIREIYGRVFEHVMKANPTSVMCSYNRVNGVKISENKKAFDMLRNDYGFDGIVVSDWDAVNNRAVSCKAGLDMEMPFNKEHAEQFAKDYNDGKVSEADIDACVERILKLYYRIEEMRKDRKSATTIDKRTEIAREIAEEGIVLLKNDGVLPIKKSASVAICGECVKPQPNDITGGGSACVTWHKNDFDMEKLLNERLSKPVKYDFAFGKLNIQWRFGISKAMKNAANSDVSVIFTSTGSIIESEGFDRTNIRLPEVQEKAILDLARANDKTVVVIFAGSCIDTTAWENEVSAIIYAGFPGEGGGKAVADILVGAVNPSGKLSETFAVLDDVPSVHSYMDCSVCEYSERLNVGYRYFNTFGEPIIYPFGYGLSYSKFEYSDLKIRKGKDLKLMLSYKIKNTSKVSGKEISQVYVGELFPRVYRPLKELKGYSKDVVPAGETITVHVELDRDAFAYYSTALDKWTVDDGIFEITVGANVEDDALKAKVEIKDGQFVK